MANFLILYFRRSPWLLAIGLAVIFLEQMIFTPTITAAVLERLLIQLSGEERSAIKEGQVSVIRLDKQFRGRLLVQTSMATAWSVLTDYNNFENFLPNVVSSQLLEVNGNHKIFEQVQVVSVLFFTRKTRVRIAITETQPQKIDFELVDGDLKTLKGSWEIEPVSANVGDSPNQVLITYQVTAEPKSAAEEGLFFQIYKDNLKASLEAIKAEIEKRSSAKNNS